MRSDFIGDCEAFLGLPQVVSRSQFLVPRLDRGQMEEAIARPGTVREAAYRPFTFANGLVNRIINDAGDRPDQLPLMQHALMRTWKLAVQRPREDGAAIELTDDDYNAAGGIENALSLDADTAWNTVKNDPRKGPYRPAAVPAPVRHLSGRPDHPPPAQSRGDPGGHRRHPRGNQPGASCVSGR